MSISTLYSFFFIFMNKFIPDNIWFVKDLVVFFGVFAFFGIFFLRNEKFVVKTCVPISKVEAGVRRE